MTALKRLNVKAVLIAMAALVLTSCATHTVKSTSYTPIQRASENVAEEFLLDIGVAIFDPGLDGLTRREEETTNAQIRVAESRYVPYMLAETLQRSGNWGHRARTAQRSEPDRRSAQWHGPSL